MERRKFTREFKLEAVKLIQERGGDGVASRAGFGGLWHGITSMGPGMYCRFTAGLSWPGADEA